MVIIPVKVTIIKKGDHHSDGVHPRNCGHPLEFYFPKV